MWWQTECHMYHFSFQFFLMVVKACCVSVRYHIFITATWYPGVSLVCGKGFLPTWFVLMLFLHPLPLQSPPLLSDSLTRTQVMVCRSTPVGHSFVEPAQQPAHPISRLRCGHNCYSLNSLQWRVCIEKRRCFLIFCIDWNVGFVCCVYRPVFVWPSNMSILLK